MAWQLGNELRSKVYAITASGGPAGDWYFRDQLRDAVSSVTRNTAEGFGRYRHREFAQFLRIARGSLFEISETLPDGTARGYWTTDSVADLQVLVKRTTAAVSRLMRYLRTHPDPEP